MPILNWVGKDKVIHHHRDVPYRVLKKQYHFSQQPAASSQQPAASSQQPAASSQQPAASSQQPAASSQQPAASIIAAGANNVNSIIHGDNLEALKSLLPEFEGRVNCIYIDPPYNTGNEGWVYNDAVNDPKIRKWLGQVVGAEGEDLSRHDKWLCMMYPRLKFLHRLLADNGAIFVSIDDTEAASLRLVMDEIFGVNNFVANILWQKRTSPDARLKIGDAHEHVFCYAKKNEHLSFKKIPQSIKQLTNFKNPDDDPRGPWASTDFSAQGFRPNQMYKVRTPSGRIVSPPPGNCWKNTEDVFLDLVADNRIWFGKNGDGVPRRKTFLSESEGVAAWTWWSNDEVGHSQEAKKEIKAILSESEIVFDTPKPTRLIQRILQIATDKNSLILDSFAGSGTTGHAVLKQNLEDGGNRRFILIEMMDYAETITAERVRRVMRGQGEGAVSGLGGGFDFYTVGERLLQEDGMLNPAAGLPAIRDYVAWTEGIPIGQCAPLISASTEGNSNSPYWLGEAHGLGLFFVWDDARATTLDLSLLTQLVKQPGRYLIYADQCALGEDFMRRHNIIYKKIPRDITRL